MMTIQPHIDAIRNGQAIDWYVAREIADAVALTKGDYLAKRVLKLLDDIQTSEAVLELIGPSEVQASREEFARRELLELLDSIVMPPKVESWVEHDLEYVQRLIGDKSRNVVPRWADNPEVKYLKRSNRRGYYMVDHSQLPNPGSTF